MGTDTPNPSRRSLLAALPAVALAAPAAAALAPASAAHPDAALIAACARFRALNAEHSALFVAIEDDDERDKAIDAMHDDWEDALDDMCMGRASTMAGAIARAQALAEYAPARLTEESGCWDDRQIAALLLDLVALLKPDMAFTPEGRPQ